MVKTAEPDFKPLPPPTAAETHGNLQTKQVRIPQGKKRPEKGLVQCNVKVRKRARDRFEHAFKRAQAATAGDDVELTKGAFFEMVLAAFEASESGGANLAEAAKIICRSPQPSAQDRRDDRSEYLEVFATPELARAIKTRSNEKGWTISGTIENACAEAMALPKEPCPHCGKAREAGKR